MNLSCLLSLVEHNSRYQELKSGLIKTPELENKLAVTNAAKPYFIASLYLGLALPILVIIPHPEDAKRLFDELQTWCPDSALLYFYPEIDFLVEGALSTTDSETMAERLKALSALTTYQKESVHNRSIPLIVSSAVAAASKTVSPSGFDKAYHTLEVGMSADPLQLVGRWQSMGYDLDDLVELRGTISRRGGIVDIFPIDNELPARIEFFGNQIDNIRLFEPKTQRSQGFVTSVTVIPAKENFTNLNNDTILDYLPDEALLILDDFDEITDIIHKINAQAKESRVAKMGNSEPVSVSDSSLISHIEFKTKINEVKRRLFFCSWDIDNSRETCLRSLPFSTVPKYGGRLGVFSRELKQKLEKNDRILIVSQQTNRLSELLQEQDILVHPVSRLEHEPRSGSVTLVQGSMTEGWLLDDILTVFTDNELFGYIKQRRLFKARSVRHHQFVSDLRPGDYMVHVDHGIGKFTGLTRIIGEGTEREYLVLEYADLDRLYVPTDQMDRVSSYIGSSDRPPKLSRLGTQEWAQTKQRVKKSVADVAEELLRLYAARETASGYAFSDDGLWQRELESSFPYMETPDQLEAVQAVKSDMEMEKPMDRLVCGDVGYGKTEIAIRAAFKAVMDNKQVALLVPTTVLAQQHFITFHERLQAFPIRVEVLSRLCSEKEQATIIEGLAAGIVDICIGTHRLLQKDVVFKELGLLIIDEEQRFGVAHKEYFKKLRQEIDILTLSATPIPRTLHMSLSGIRDLSVMETPPEDRLPIKTKIGTYDERLIREAILRELQRNGQVFFVHNRVQSINSLANKLTDLIPEAVISVAHGQMREEELEKVMVEFAGHRSDVLLTTTIIESGLDMPNVNTLIIDKSDKLGLTQLYQLRGRVGRGCNNAYAYFLFDKGKQLTPQARKRLKIISEATELGAGFAIAMKDLEIRGAGNLLGVKQSGHIAAVGFDLYCRLLADAVLELKRGKSRKIEPERVMPPVPSISLPMVSYIPDEYIASENTRIAFYQRLAVVKTAMEREDIADELRDRFGTLPQAVKNLLYVVDIKQLAVEARVGSISTKDRQIIVHFNGANELRGLQLPQDYKDGIVIGTRQVKLNIRQFGNRWPDVLRKILQIVALNKELSQ